MKIPSAQSKDAQGTHKASPFNKHIIFTISSFLIAAAYLYTIFQLDYLMEDYFKPSRSVPIVAIRILFILLSISSIYFLLFTVFMNRWISSLLVLLSGLLMLSNIAYFRYYESYISITDLLLIKQVPFVVDFALSLLMWRDSFVIACTAISFIILITRPSKWRRPSLPMISSLFFLALSFSFLRVIAHTPTPRFDLRNVRNTVFENSARTTSVTNFGFILGAAKDINRVLKIDRGEKKINGRMLYAESHKPDAASSNKPDIIVIQLESFGSSLLGRTENGKEITPFINKLARENIFFSNIYAVHTRAGGTSDADFSVLSGIHPLTSVTSFFAQNLENLPALPWVLGLNGYETAVYHANIRSFWNRSKAFSALGLQTFYSKKDYNGLPKTEYGVVSDKYFYKRTIEYINNLNRPFFAYIISISGHGPYNHILFEFTEEFDQSITNPDLLMQNYLRVMNLADSNLQRLYNDLTSMLDNYIILIIGDHEAYLGPSNEVREKVPMIIVTSDKSQHAEVIDNIGTHVDLAPTLLGLTNIASPADWTGINLLSSPQRSSICLASPPTRVLTDGTHIKDEGCFNDEIRRVEKYLAF